MFIRDEITKLEDSFATVGALVNVHYTINHVGLPTAARWTGYLVLERFIERLPDLELYNPQLYTILTDNHKEAIDKAKNLALELKAQNLPMPYIEVYHNSNECYSLKTMKYLVTIERDNIHNYFNEYYSGSIDYKKVLEKASEYRDKVGAALVELCEAIALIVYQQLVDKIDTPLLFDLLNRTEIEPLTCSTD